MESKDKIPEDFYMSYHNSELYAQDFKGFHNRNWLTSNSIKFYYEDLKQTYQEPQYLLFDPFQSQLLLDIYSDYECLVDWFYDKFSKADYIFFPINDEESNQIPGGGNHWALVVYEKSSKQFVYYDSNNSYLQNAEKLSLMAKAILEKDEKILKNKQKNDNLTINKQTPLQKNSYDCGMFVISITEALLHIFQDGKIELGKSDSKLNQLVNQNIVTEKRKKIVQFIKELLSKKN